MTNQDTPRHGDHRLSVTVEPVSSLGVAVRREWAQLADRAVEPNPEFSPSVLVPAARWLPAGASVQLAMVRRAGRLVLAMPLHKGRYRRMPVKAFTTWSHTCRSLGTPLVDPDGLDLAPTALLAELAGRRSPGWLVLDQLYLDGPVADAFRAATADCSATWVEHDVRRRPAVRARDQETYLADTVSSRSGKTLRRRRRHLERDHGPVALRDGAAHADPAAVDAEVEAFLQLEAAGWKGRAGTALVSDPDQANFWRESCRALAKAGRLHLWQLTAGDRVVARQCDVRWGDTIFNLKITYDEGLARYSPGVQLDLELLHAFHLDPTLSCLDSCAGRGAGGLVPHYPDGRPIGDALIGLTALGRPTAQVTPWAATAWRRFRYGSPASADRGSEGARQEAALTGG